MTLGGQLRAWNKRKQRKPLFLDFVGTDFTPNPHPSANTAVIATSLSFLFSLFCGSQRLCVSELILLRFVYEVIPKQQKP
jgi:hypothetical protein